MWWRTGLVWLALVCIAGASALVLSQRYLAVSVTGASMSPALLPGDVVFVHRTREIGSGKIALLRARSGSLVLHRVVAIAEDGSIRTRGDANPIVDLEATPPARIVGDVVRVIPAGIVFQRWRAASAYATLTAQQNSARR